MGKKINYRSTTSLGLILGITIAAKGFETGNTDVINFGLWVSAVFGLLFFYYLNKHEHFVSRLTRWAKRSKLLYPNGSKRKKHQNKRTTGKSKNTRSRKKR